MTNAHDAMHGRPIVFDFDGTICDSLMVAVEVLNTLSKEFGFRSIAHDELPVIRMMNTSDLMTHLRINRLQVPFVAYKAKRIIQERIHSLVPIQGVSEVLKELRRRGARIGIVTSNSSANVDQFLKLNDLDVFDFIYADSSIFGKASTLKKMLKERNIHRNDVTYVGDEVRDIEAARSIPIRMISVAWGYHTRDLLLRERPDVLVDHPSELLERIF